MKLGKAVVPNLRETLDGPPEPPLSTEAYQRYRRSLGKMAWLSQTREDLHIFIAYLATGQHAPDGRHEKAMRQVLRFLLFDGDQELSFPSPGNLKSLFQGSVELSGEPLMVVFCDASHAPMRATQRKGISWSFHFRVIFTCEGILTSPDVHITVKLRSRDVCNSGDGTGGHGSLTVSEKDGE